MARDIVSEAVEQAEAMKSAAYENAKSVLVEAMSTNLKAAVTEAIDEKLDDADVEATEDAEESVDEASVEEGKDWGGNKGDESKSRRDFEEGEIEEDEDEEEIADDAYDVDDDDDEDEDLDENDDEDEEYGGNKGDESRSKRDFESAIKENKSLKKENARYAKALTFLKKRIDEVNLFNARLAAAGDLMKGVTLTKEEKERVVEHFDTCKTINEVKRTFKVLGEAYAGTDRAVKKQRVERPNVQSVISEESKAKSATDNTFARLSQLAGL